MLRFCRLLDLNPLPFPSGKKKVDFRTDLSLNFCLFSTFCFFWEEVSARTKLCAPFGVVHVFNPKP